VATKQVNIDILAKDKTKQAMQSATKGVDKLKSAVFNLRNAFVGLGAGLVVKSFVDVGKQVESLQVRLKFLFGSAEEGAKAFDTMAKFAGKVPFSLEQIQAGAGSLAVVSKDADELAKMLEITGNVAAVTGLDFRTASEQIQRSFSAGIASADIFRERGVRDLLGFKAGATITAEETAEAFERVFGNGGKLAGATKDLAKTLEGTLSMIGDKYFAFQKTVAEAFFVGLKQEFGALDKTLQDNEAVIQKVARAVGKGLSDAVIMAGKAVEFLKDNFEIIKAIGMGIIVGKIATAFLNLAVAIGTAKGALLAFSKVSKTTVIGALLGIAVALKEFTGETEKAIEPNKKLKDLLENKRLLELQLSKTGNQVTESLKKQLEFLNKQIEAEKSSATVKALTDEQTQKQIKSSEEFTKSIEKQIKAIVDLNKKERERFITGSEFQGIGDPVMSGQDAVMGAMPTKGALQKIEEDKLEIQKQMQETYYQNLQDNAELEVELRRITADRTLQIAYETAEKEKEIRKKAFDDNFNLIKSGKAGEINLEKLSGKDKMDLAKKVGREALDQLAQNNKKAFMLNKAFNIVEAIMNTATGISKALALGPIIGPPLALAIGALGAVQVATIAGAKYQGRRLGGRMNQDQPYLVGEAGPELVVPDRASNVVPNGQLGNMGKQVNVNFHITTVDATGFSELLVNSRATIVNVINQALNEKGKEVLV